MPDAKWPPDGLAVIEVIAGAIRNELGTEVEAYPGCHAPEGADPLNRAFRAVVRALLAAGPVPADDRTASVSRTLFLIASRRLEAEGWDEQQVKSRIEEEPGSPDDWLTFLVLSSRPQIEPPLELAHD